MVIVLAISVAVIKYHNLINIKNKEFILGLQLQRVRTQKGQKTMAWQQSQEAG